ncbi:MAG: VIT1/CCC1 transporter family protein [Candidatus Lokiarchaeota archaeon]|nr:VIT1/CCC1 transporter family protein [Candidatus Lokiarchaeota archaeon]
MLSKLTRDLKKSREAFEKRDVELSKAAHTTFAPEQHQQEKGKYLKSIVYGGLDGIITTFAVVAGVKGAELSLAIVLILGIANLLADGLSMGIGDFLSSKSEIEYQKKERERETWEVDNFPEGEKQELIELYQQKGLNAEDSKKIVDIFSKNKKTWIDIMMIEELGIIEETESPIGNAIATFISFALFGAIPLITYVLALFIDPLKNNQILLFIIACIVTSITLFILGALKTNITGKKFWISGLETFIVGAIAATAAYLIGFGLSFLI